MAIVHDGGSIQMMPGKKEERPAVLSWFASLGPKDVRTTDDPEPPRHPSRGREGPDYIAWAARNLDDEMFAKGYGRRARHLLRFYGEDEIIGPRLKKLL